MTQEKPAPQATLIDIAESALDGAPIIDPLLRASLERVAVHQSSHGPYLVQYTQRFHGVKIIGSRLSVLIDRQLNARALSGSWLPAAQFVHSDKAWNLAPEQALRVALEALDLPAADEKSFEVLSRQGDFTRLRWSPEPQTSSLPARLQAGWLAGDGRLQAVYSVEVIAQRPGGDVPLAKRLLISAADGKVLRQNSLIHHQSAAYRVFADEHGHPYVDPYGFTNPHPSALRDGSRPTQPAPMRIIEWAHSGIHTGDPWLPASASGTVGNNVDAFFNQMPLLNGRYDWWFNGPDSLRFFDAAVGDHRAPFSSPRRFDYAYDVNQAPADYFQFYNQPPTLAPPFASQQFNAKIVQAFYAANWLHDLFYNLGYDEPSGNSQDNNFGRGGLGGDRLLIHAGASSTFAMVPDDGVSPLLVLGHNGVSLSNRDVSGFAFDVLAHEWSHVLYVRLAGWSDLAQMGAMNEGFADFVGMLLSVRAQDRDRTTPAFNGAYAVGGYMNLDYFESRSGLPPAGSPGLPDNSYYHGIRRFPYSADLALNPLSFRHVSMDHPLPAAWLAFDWKGRSLLNAEIHSAGEVWASALWQCARNILAQGAPEDFQSNRNRVLAYLVAGLKLAPADHTFTEARDALLLAMRSDDETAYLQCRAGFAARGMGAGALSPPRTSTDFRGVEESFLDGDHALSITDLALVPLVGEDTILNYGEAGELRITVANSGLAPISGARIEAESSDGRLHLAQVVLSPDLTLAPGEQRTLSVPVHLLTAQGQVEVALEARAQHAGHGLDVREVGQFRVNYALTGRTTVDDATAPESFASNWTVAFGNNPHGCSFTGICIREAVNWIRREHAGEPAYLVGDARIGLDAQLISPSFRASISEALTLQLRHDYSFDRSGTQGRIEISLDGGVWQLPDAFLQQGGSILLGSSSGYRETALDFGTRLAGRHLRFRLRAIASPTLHPQPTYWAVSRVTLGGSDVPLFIQPAAPQPSVGPQHSGSYYVPARSGEGWTVEVLNAQSASVIWYTYPPAGSDGGQQQWILGVGRIEGNRIVVDQALLTRGAVFGPDFDPDDVQQSPWGRLELEFNSCNDLVVRYAGPSEFGSGIHQASRLAGINGLNCDGGTPTPAASGYSGTWYDTSHNGEGLVFQEIDSSSAALYWFSYDAHGEQAWFTGIGQRQGNLYRFADVFRPHGSAFGPDFDPSDLSIERWGAVELRFNDCNRADLTYTATDPAYGSGTLSTVRLTQLAGLPCDEP